MGETITRGHWADTLNLLATPELGKLLLAAAAFGYLTASTLLNAFGKAQRQARTIPVLLECEGRKQLLRAMVDTGNCLTDPLDGRPVLVVDAAAAKRIFPDGLCPDDAILRSPAQSLGQLSESWEPSRLRLISYRSVGVPHGLLLAVRLDRIEADGRAFPGQLAAIIPGTLEPGIHGLVGIY